MNIYLTAPLLMDGTCRPASTRYALNNHIYAQQYYSRSTTCAMFAAKVVNLESPPAAAVKLDDIKASLEQHKPAALFLCQVCHNTNVRLHRCIKVAEAQSSRGFWLHVASTVDCMQDFQTHYYALPSVLCCCCCSVQIKPFPIVSF